jgi:anti-anti-sigma factor
MEQMEIIRETGPAGSTAILRLNCSLTLSTESLLQEKLREIAGCDTVIDLNEVRYVDSAGLGAILGHWTRSQVAGHRVALAGVKPRVEALLETAHVKKLFPIFRTAEEAVASFAGTA